MAAGGLERLVQMLHIHSSHSLVLCTMPGLCLGQLLPCILVLHGIEDYRRGGVVEPSSTVPRLALAMLARDATRPPAVACFCVPRLARPATLGYDIS